jgi:membrane-associated phospholipid phosphatase
MHRGRVSQQDVGAAWAPQRAAETVPVWLGAVAVQDAVLLGFLVTMRLLVGLADGQAGSAAAARVIEAALALLGVGVLVGRVLPAIPAAVRCIVYRVSIAGTLLVSYLMLRDVLLVVRTDSLDAALVHLDQRLFGVTPAVWLERYSTPAVVEYFSFFYFSYFSILAIYMVVVVWLEPPGRQTAVFAIGTLLVFAIGQLGYVLVPGYGPYAHLASSFTRPLEGGFFWDLVQRTVQAGGAMKDIFPSLHTAVPTWLTLYAIGRARRSARWKWAAIITGLSAVNIVVSTMLLRWHYGVDVIAGLSLAALVRVIAPKLARWEERRRARFGHPQPWTFEVEPESAAAHP